MTSLSASVSLSVNGANNTFYAWCQDIIAIINETTPSMGLPVRVDSPAQRLHMLTELGLLSLRQFLPILSSHWTISLCYYKKKKRLDFNLWNVSFFFFFFFFFFKEKPN